MGGSDSWFLFLGNGQITCSCNNKITTYLWSKEASHKLKKTRIQSLHLNDSNTNIYIRQCSTPLTTYRIILRYVVNNAPITQTKVQYAYLHKVCYNLSYGKNNHSFKYCILCIKITNMISAVWHSLVLLGEIKNKENYNKCGMTTTLIIAI